MSMIIEFLSNLTFGGIFAAMVTITAICLIGNSYEKRSPLTNQIRERFNYWEPEPTNQVKTGTDLPTVGYSHSDKFYEI